MELQIIFFFLTLIFLFSFLGLWAYIPSENFRRPSPTPTPPPPQLQKSTDVVLAGVGRIPLPFSFGDLKAHHKTSAEDLIDPKDVSVEVALPGEFQSQSGPSPVHTEHSPTLLKSSIVCSGGVDKVRNNPGFHSPPPFPSLHGIGLLLGHLLLCFLLLPPALRWWHWVEVIKRCLQKPTFSKQSLILGSLNAASPLPYKESWNWGGSF